jgi:diguanylate cyclase (GGDEF)-like protein
VDHFLDPLTLSVSASARNSGPVPKIDRFEGRCIKFYGISQTDCQDWDVRNAKYRSRYWGSAVPTLQIANFAIDLPTLSTVLAFVTLTGGSLLLFSWTQHRNVPSLGLWGLGYSLGSAAAAVLTFGQFVPNGWSICVAPMLICCAYGVLWGGARSFEGRQIRVWWMFAGGALWIGAYQVASFHDSAHARSVLASLITATYALLAAREIWYARDRELLSRWPTLVLILLHAGFLLGRIPLSHAFSFAPLGGQAHGPVILVVVFEALFTTLCLAFLRVSMAKERAELEQRRVAETDSLTGIANRRAFFNRGEPLLAQTVAGRQAAALLLFDIDRFKDVNDTAGHHAGDQVLRTFSDLVATSLRPGDLFGRLGGEEFACRLPQVSMAEALRVAERLRGDFAARRLPGLETSPTVSVGVAMASDADWNLSALLATADRALYRAKSEGRNRVAPAPLVLVGLGDSDAKKHVTASDPIKASLAG